MKTEATPIILKLGGSIITDKIKPITFRNSVAKRVAKEVSRANADSILIVHGGGSFGHPLAKKYKLASGFTDKFQLDGFVKTRQSMSTLNKLVIDVLVDEGLKAVSIQPSAFIVTQNGQIVDFNIAPIERMLNLGLVPVLYGDIVLDSARVFTILSGDQIISRLASELKCKKVILACDVDGVYSADPKVDPSAKLIRKLTLTSLKNKVKDSKESGVADVTGLMKGKLDEMSYALKRDVQIIILNGLKRDRIYRALKGLDTYGTILSS